MRPVLFHTPTNPSADERVQEEAALWFARLRGDRVSTALRVDFASWLAADPAHRREYEILEQVWDHSARLAPSPETKRRAGRRGSQFARNVFVVAGIGLAGFLANMAWLDGRVATDPGERRHMQLADGSELDVGPQARLRLSFDGSRRRLDLAEGKIVVSVATDRQRPFEVSVAGHLIRDIGTRFEVETGRERTRVTVAEGIVDIVGPANGSNASRRLVAGEGADIDGRGISAPMRVDSGAALAWTRRQLSFDAVPLADVFAALNEFRRHPIVLDDPTLQGIRISGVFLLDDEAATLSALALVAPIRFTASGSTVLARKATYRLDAHPKSGS